MKTKEKWSKIWREFNKWGKANDYPDWNKQKAMLGPLIRQEFGVNMRRFWNKVDNLYETRAKRTTFGVLYLSWRSQRNIIKQVCEERME